MVSVWGVCGECVHLSAERVRCKRPSPASLFVQLHVVFS